MRAVCKLCLLVAIIPVIQSSGRQQVNTCVSPQYVELGGSGTISCTFQDDLFSLLWYDTADYQHNEPVLQYRSSIKSGEGYDLGEYDIHPNGSLSIREVSLQHNRTFAVAYIPTEEDASTVIKVRVIVTYETLVQCPSTQYGNVGRVGIIRCNIAVDFNNISWYKEGVGDAVVRYDRKATKDATGALGNDDAGYSLLIDGSLLIFEVKAEESKGRYKIELIDNSAFGKLSQTVEFIVMDGTPTTPSTTAETITNNIKTTTAQNMYSSHSLEASQKGPFDTLILVINILLLLLVIFLVLAVLFTYGKLR